MENPLAAVSAVAVHTLAYAIRRLLRLSKNKSNAVWDSVPIAPIFLHTKLASCLHPVFLDAGSSFL